jgi:hypothetical protein
MKTSLLLLRVVASASVFLLADGCSAGNFSPASRPAAAPAPPMAPASAGASPPDLAPPAPAVAGTAAGLTVVLAAIEEATVALSGATVSTHGGYVQQGLVDLAAARDSANTALVLARAHPALDTVPASPSPRSQAALAQLGAFHRTGRSQPNMYRALAGVKRALTALEAVPGGDLGGTRDNLIISLVRAANDVITGIQFSNQRAQTIQSEQNPDDLKARAALGD